jgi:hypothetical protein
MDNLLNVGPLAMHKTRLKQGTMAGQVAEPRSFEMAPDRRATQE